VCEQKEITCTFFDNGDHYYAFPCTYSEALKDSRERRRKQLVSHNLRKEQILTKTS